MTAANANLVWNQLPQPARPPNSYDMSLETPSTAYPQNLENSKFSNVDVVPVPPTMAKEVEGERKLGAVGKLVDSVKDKYEKLPESFRDQMHMKERNRNVESECSNSRGLKQPVVEEKLERFKVRTVVAEEVVKEDGKK
ncbi:hypothetical protein VNO77_17759 [Canavalia gladiata]|uniref:Uncharacterized protein n=1 Tax=Canavalia gladiata TaxID=3824 RepID=A0AAN9LJI3_CANGL